MCDEQCHYAIKDAYKLGWEEARAESKGKIDLLLAIAEAAQSYMAIRHPYGDLMTTTTFSPEMDKAAIVLMDALSLLPNAQDQRRV